jgi:hypothetical protein
VLARAIEWAADQGASFINLSLGTPNTEHRRCWRNRLHERNEVAPRSCRQRGTTRWSGFPDRCPARWECCSTGTARAMRSGDRRRAMGGGSMLLRGIRDRFLVFHPNGTSRASASRSPT